MNSLGFIVPTITRQQLTRSLYTSATQSNGESLKNFAEALAEKFINQVKKQRQKKKDLTRLIQIELLPFTATAEDIRKLAREAFPKGDKSIVDMVFCRKENFAPNGKCVLLMTSGEDARRLVLYGNRRALGGNMIRMSFARKSTRDPDGYLNNLRQNELRSATGTSTTATTAGQSVIITGFYSSSTEKLLDYLSTKHFYPVDNILFLKSKHGSAKHKHLIKFNTESEAWRCVRAFHNRQHTFDKKTYTVQVDVLY